MKRKLKEGGCGCGGGCGCMDRDLDHRDSGRKDQKEGKMAKYTALECAEDAQDVANMIKETDNLPEWLEAKITLASDYMNKVKDYMTHYVRGTEPAPSYNKLSVRRDDFKPAYPMIIQTQDEMKDLMKEIIRKVDEKKWALYSKKKRNGRRKRLGTFDSLEAAKERERQINYFKHR